VLSRCLNELSLLYPRRKYQELVAQSARLHLADTPRDPQNPKPHVVKRTLHHRREKYEIALTTVIHCENVLNIDPLQRWALDSPMCHEAFKAATEHAYRRALDHLSHAVVQRILELHKMGLPGTCRFSQLLFTNLTSLCGLGYKQRKKISAGLKKRSRTVNTVLTEYNKQAARLGCPELDFQQVVEYTFLSDFELLHHTFHDITQRPWANPLIRNAMISWMKIERAKEEISRLNVEARRLKTYIHDSSAARELTIQHLQQTDPTLAVELQQRHDTQSHINALLLQQLRKLESLPGFSGCRTLGVCAGDILVDPRHESDEDGGAIVEDEEGDMEDDIVGDAAVEDDIGDQLYALDNVPSDPIMYRL